MTHSPTVVATGTILRPELITAKVAAEEKDALASLVAAGTVTSAYLHEGRLGVTAIVSAATTEDAARALHTLPYVALGILTFDFVVASSLTD